MRTLVFVSIAALALASGSTAHAQAPSAKPATGSTGSTGSTAVKPSTGPATTTGTTQAKPATGAPAPTAKPQPPAPTPPPPAKPVTPVPPPPTTPVAPAPPTAAPPPPPSSDAYTYQSEGRRDPFLSLVASAGPTPTPNPNRKTGPQGMAVAEIQVRGVVQSRGALIAMIMGPDNKTYIVHQGDKLLDGTIKTITPQGLIIIQEVNDPLSLVKQREVRKLLRSLEDAK
jgi:Tfp pilus assembly protein PilP